MKVKKGVKYEQQHKNNTCATLNCYNALRDVVEEGDEDDEKLHQVQAQNMIAPNREWMKAVTMIQPMKNCQMKLSAKLLKKIKTHIVKNVTT